MTDRLTVVFVHAVTAALAFASGWYVLTQGSPLPVMDEWDLLTDWATAPSTAAWDIAHHGEHRFPLPKLLWLAALRATGYDFHAVMFATLTLLTATGTLLMWTARGLRGRQHPLDALFPALLLHWGHGFNLIMSYQLGFALVAYALAGWLWCARREAEGTVWRLGAIGYPLLAIPCGGFGVTFAPVVAGWYGWLAWRDWKSGHLGRAAVPLLAGVAVVGYTAWVVRTMPLGLLPTTSPVTDPLNFIAAAVGYLSVAVGVWPAETAVGRWAVGVSVVLLYALGLWRGVTRFRTRKTPVDAALLAVIAGSLLTAAATAYARGIGYSERMADASAVGLAAAWLAAFHPWRGGVGWSVPVALLAVGGLFWANWTPGLNWAIQLRHTTWSIRQDLRAGAWPSLLASRYAHSTAVLVGVRMTHQLPVFRDLGVPEFGNVPADPPAVAVPVVGLALPLRVAAPADTPLPDLIPPPRAFALRLLVRTSAAITRERVTLTWTEDGKRQEAPARPLPTPGDSHLIYPTRGRLTDVRLRPDEGITEVLVTGAEWLVSPEGGG